MSLNDQAWEETFLKHDVLSRVEQDGFADVTANDLRAFREPRLMAKIDHTKNLPDVFRENRLSILPLTTDTYRIGHFRIFEPLADSEVTQTEVLTWPTGLESLGPGQLTGEAAILHTAWAANILQDFTQSALIPTTSGRMRTGTFDFQVDCFDSASETIPVAGAQIEIDGGYEGNEALYLIEAKAHGAADFNIRQLYYPYRTWLERIGKDIRPTYLIYENEEFTLYEYAFADSRDFSSLKLVKCKRYALSTEKVGAHELIQIADAHLGVRPNHSVPYPQADSFDRVVDLIEVVLDHPCTVDDLADYYRFDKRQAKYYLDAATYLGFISKRLNEFGTSAWHPTDLAHSVFSLGSVARNSELAKVILKHDSFARTFLESSEKGGRISKDEVVLILQNSNDLEPYSGSTIPRRASTVRAWISWIWEEAVSR